MFKACCTYEHVHCLFTLNKLENGLRHSQNLHFVSDEIKSQYGLKYDSCVFSVFAHHICGLSPKYGISPQEKIPQKCTLPDDSSVFF